MRLVRSAYYPGLRQLGTAFRPTAPAVRHHHQPKIALTHALGGTDLPHQKSNDKLVASSGLTPSDRRHLDQRRATRSGDDPILLSLLRAPQDEHKRNSRNQRNETAQNKFLHASSEACARMHSWRLDPSC